VLLDSIPFAEATDVILGGNHDVVNDVNKKSTLHVINEMFPGKVAMPEFGKVVVSNTTLGRCNFVTIPHHSSKQLFLEALEGADKLLSEDHINYLVLHCNYNSGYATNDTDLNITTGECESLLVDFDYILIGHDHHPKTDLGDRVIVLGNIHPTNFGDITDKHYLVINENGHPQGYETCWLDNQYVCVNYTQIDRVDPEHHQFVRITGNASPSDIPDLSRAIKKLWDANDCRICAIRSEVTITTEGKDGMGIVTTTNEKITDVIRRELADQKELLTMWEEISYVEEA